MCLLIGSPGVGKTLLLKRLNTCSNRGSYSNVGDPPSTIPTVGTNLVNVVTTKKQEVTVRELGGCMGPIWHNYYKDSSCVLFMIDLSNKMQVSSSCIQLLEVLTNKALLDVPFLILLNKIDIPNAMKRIEFDSIIRLKDILRNSTQQITVLETSAKDGENLASVAKWIQDHGKINT